MSELESTKVRQGTRTPIRTAEEAAKSRCRQARATAAHSPDCPPALLGGLLCEFPHLVLGNPVLPLALAAEPHLCDAWPIEAIAILGTSAHSQLAHRAAGALGGPGAAAVRTFMAWWRAQARPPLDPTACEVQCRSAARGLSLSAYQRLLALSHLTHAAGLREFNVTESANRVGSEISTKVTGVALGTGSTLDLDASWGAMVADALNVANEGAEFTYRAMHIVPGERISIRSELRPMLGFEVRRTSRNNGIIAEVNEPHSEPQRRRPRDRAAAIAALARAEAAIQELAPNGLLLWSNSRELEIGGTWTKATRVPVIARLSAAVSEDAAEIWNPDDAKHDDDIISEMIATSVRNDEPGILVDDLEYLEGEVLDCRNAGDSIATDVEKVLAATFFRDETGDRGLDTHAADIVCAVFSAGRLLRIFGFGAQELRSRREITLLLDKVVRQDSDIAAPST